MLAWTIVGALIPGSGLIAAGWRKLGAFLLFILGLGGAAIAAMAMVGDPVERVISLAVNRQRMLILVFVIVGIALAWIAVILLTNSQLRRYATLTSGQRAFSALVVTALVAAIALPAYEVSHYTLITRDLVGTVFGGDDESDGAAPSTEKADPWAGTPRMNVLLIGSDAGKGRTGVRPDTLILASINTRSGDTVLFSLPRNLERAPFPLGSAGNQAWPDGFFCENDQCLLNAVWTWAEGDGKRYYPNKKNPGLAATEEAVEGVTGLKVDTYAMLNLDGFSQFVNAIGGLRLNVTERLPIGGNSEHPEQTSGYIERGKNQLLDGYETLWYARSRWSTNDYDRMRRQRCVIGAVSQQADPVKMALAFPGIAKAAKDNLSTGIPVQELDAWVDLTQRIQKASVRSLPFTDDVITDRTDPDYDQIHALVTKALTPPVARTQATPSAGAATPSPAVPRKSKKAAINPLKAQDINDVC